MRILERKLKQIQAKKLVNKSISRFFLYIFHKNTFRKWKISDNKFHEIDLFDFTSFFLAGTFFLIFWPTVHFKGHDKNCNFAKEEEVKDIVNRLDCQKGF